MDLKLQGPNPHDDDEHKQTENKHIDAHSSDDEHTASPQDHQHPLFMLAPPTRPNLACDALAAIIDEDALQPAERPSRKRRAVTLGEAQVHLSLTGLGPAHDGAHSPQNKRSRPAACTNAR